MHTRLTLSCVCDESLAQAIIDLISGEQNVSLLRFELTTDKTLELYNRYHNGQKDEHGHVVSPTKRSSTNYVYVALAPHCFTARDEYPYLVWFPRTTNNGSASGGEHEHIGYARTATEGAELLARIFETPESLERCIAHLGNAEALEREFGHGYYFLTSRKV